jgi:ATP-dependent DNA helicase RecG
MRKQKDRPPEDVPLYDLLEHVPETKLEQLLTVEEIYTRGDPSFFKKQTEDRRIERKPSGHHPDALGEYFSMWANTAPDGGILILGMENDGKITGCSKLNIKQLNRLEQSGRTYCPDARYESKRIETEREDGQKDFILLFHVLYRPDKVVKDVRGTACVRFGDQKRKLSDEEIRELQIDRRQVPFEHEPCGLRYPTDFNTELIRQFVNNVKSSRAIEERQTDEDVLELRHLGKRNGGRFIPNNACAILFGKDPAEVFPGCKIRFLRFEGEREGTGEHFNAVKDEWVEGPVPMLILEAEKILDAQVRTFSRLATDGKFYAIPEYPKVAWYEAVVNACVHRSYGLRNMNIFIKMFDDRLEIESPGGFPPLVTPENIYDTHHPRNPDVMDAMFYMKFVKCAHEGTRRMRDTMRAMELPAPEFQQKETAHTLVTVTLRNNIKHRKVWIDFDASSLVGEALYQTLTDKERQAINFVAEYKKINVSQAMRLTGLNWHTAKKLLMGLKSKKILDDIRRADLDRDSQSYFYLRNIMPKSTPAKTNGSQEKSEKKKKPHSDK